MDITVSYTKENGFQMKMPEQGDLDEEVYYATLGALTGYAMLVISMMRADCSRPATRMMLEYAVNRTRQMLDDDVIFDAVKKGIEANERYAHKPTPEVVRSDTERTEDD